MSTIVIRLAHSAYAACLLRNARKRAPSLQLKLHTVGTHE